MASREISYFSGSDGQKSAHGIPHDLLDRLLIIPTRMYTPDEVECILRIRATAEALKISAESIKRLAGVAIEQSSLRYAVQLLTPCRLLAQMNNRWAGIWK